MAMRPPRGSGAPRLQQPKMVHSTSPQWRAPRQQHSPPWRREGKDGASQANNAFTRHNVSATHWSAWVHKDPPSQSHNRTNNPKPRGRQATFKHCDDDAHVELFGTLQKRVLGNPDLKDKPPPAHRKTDLMPHNDGSAHAMALLQRGVVARSISPTIPKPVVAGIRQPAFTLDGSAPRAHDPGPLDQQAGWREGDPGGFTFDGSEAVRHEFKQPTGDWRLGDTGGYSYDMSEVTRPERGRLDQQGGWRVGDSKPLNVTGGRAEEGPRDRLDQQGGWRVGDNKPLNVTGGRAEEGPRGRLDQQGGWRMGDREPVDVGGRAEEGPRGPLDQQAGWRMGDSKAVDVGGRAEEGPRGPLDQQAGWRMGDRTPFDVGGRVPTGQSRASGLKKQLTMGPGLVITEEVPGAPTPRRGKDRELFVSRAVPSHPCAPGAQDTPLPICGRRANDITSDKMWARSLGPDHVNAEGAERSHGRRCAQELHGVQSMGRAGHDMRYRPPDPIKRTFVRYGMSEVPRNAPANPAVGGGTVSLRATDITTCGRDASGSKCHEYSGERIDPARDLDQPRFGGDFTLPHSDLHPRHAEAFARRLLADRRNSGPPATGGAEDRAPRLALGHSSSAGAVGPSEVTPRRRSVSFALLGQ